MRAGSSLTDVPTCTISVIPLYVHLCFRHRRIVWQVEHVDNPTLFHDCNGLRALCFSISTLPRSSFKYSCLPHSASLFGRHVCSLTYPLNEKSPKSSVSMEPRCRFASVLVIYRSSGFPPFREIAGLPIELDGRFVIVIAFGMMYRFTEKKIIYLYFYLKGKGRTASPPFLIFHLHLSP